ncbi:S8 family peptidase [Kribbella sp. CA-293567]|uniref:S8 family peptidase n=1 Tax=Kribbella sp. CA-293567 TaxID=3002436 RepID=UPI0022DD3445|nr:S8 family serine peptidase [Kribbella sp. CA-293567]WBQ08231.1 S8 family serine peptidase [Kribbella sp. CA-293567]
MSDNQVPDENGDPKGEDPRGKYIDQVELLIEAFGEELEIAPEDWRKAGVDYLYRAGSVVVRDEDLPRVVELFGGGTPDDGGINGVTRLVLPRKVPDPAPRAATDTQRFLLYADRRLGRGVVTPEHLVFVSPSVSPCPATEPEEVPAGIEPAPKGDGKSTGRGVKVVVLDVGWTDAPQAPWLDGVTGDAEQVYDPQTQLIEPYAGHGTFIAGVLRMIAPEAEVVVKGYLDRAGAMWEVDLAEKLSEVLDLSPDIISLSAGTKTRFDLPAVGLDVFVRTQLNRVNGLVLVAAAGNDGDREYFWPAAFPEAVSVGALAADGQSRASFSNYGTWVDVYAPGEDLVNAYLDGKYRCTERPDTGTIRTFQGMARWSGTSFATPLVAGLIAARMSVTGQTAQQAAGSLLDFSLTQAIPGVGAILRPEDALR